MLRNLSEDQINSLHILFKFLRRLKAIGIVETKIISYRISENGVTNRVFDVDISQYFPGQYKTVDEELADVFSSSYSLLFRQ